MVREVAHARKPNPLFDLNEILQVVDLSDVITCANLGEDRLMGFGVVAGQSLSFFIDFDLRSYDILSLPCECVISL